MGTPRLRIKTELNYRRGYTSRSCGDCSHLVRLESATSSPTNEYRCRVIGIKPGRLYRINPNNICDAFDDGGHNP